MSAQVHRAMMVGSEIIKKASLTSCEHAIRRAWRDEKVSKVVKTDSPDGQTARSELLILRHKPPESCSVPRCARCHCKRG
jgi:hypothetical protein